MEPRELAKKDLKNTDKSLDEAMRLVNACSRRRDYEGVHAAIAAGDFVMRIVAFRKEHGFYDA